MMTKWKMAIVQSPFNRSKVKKYLNFSSTLMRSEQDSVLTPRCDYFSLLYKLRQS